LTTGNTTSKRVSLSFATKDSQHGIRVESIYELLERLSEDPAAVSYELAAIDLERIAVPDLRGATLDIQSLSLLHWCDFFHHVTIRTSTLSIPYESNDFSSPWVTETVYHCIEPASVAALVPSLPSDATVFAVDIGPQTRLVSLEQMLVDGMSGIGSPLWGLLRGHTPLSYGFRFLHFVKDGRGYVALVLRGVNVRACNMDNIKTRVGHLLLATDSLDWARVLHEALIRSHIYLLRVDSHSQLQQLINTWRVPSWKVDRGRLEYTTLCNVSTRMMPMVARRLGQHLI